MGSIVRITSHTYYINQLGLHGHSQLSQQQGTNTHCCTTLEKESSVIGSNSILNTTTLPTHHLDIWIQHTLKHSEQVFCNRPEGDMNTVACIQTDTFITDTLPSFPSHFLHAPFMHIHSIIPTSPVMHRLYINLRKNTLADHVSITMKYQ